jgi:acetoin utilization deacetylase AcuC-like enzyme
MKTGFATYLHPETCLTSKPREQIGFEGYSWPHLCTVRQKLAESLTYASLPLRKAEWVDFQRVHTSLYLEKIQQLAAELVPEPPPRLSAECKGLEFCLPGYEYGLGGMFEAIDWMKQGKLTRSGHFCLGGHHAYADWGHGYCLLNPMAVAIRYAQEVGFVRVLIVDWDHHHGDGTQAIFANDSTVYCISIHSLDDLYMTLMGALRQATTTAAENVGHCNIPVLSGKYSDSFLKEMNLPGDFYRANTCLPAFDRALDTLPWPPDLICILSGYDAHRDDLGYDTAKWTNEEYRHLTARVITLANRHHCPILSTNGGGYRLDTTVSAALTHLHTLATFSPS